MAVRDTGRLPDTTAKHSSLLHKIVLIGAWTQVLGGAAAAPAAVAVV